MKLPSPSPDRLAVRLTPDATRQVAAGHPWVYADSITSIGPAGHPRAAGDLAVIFRPDRSFLAIGLYDPRSPIRIKVVHRGRPVTVDAEFWRTRLRAALDLRSPLIEAGHTTAYRCVNGENDGFPGFVLDRYADTLVVKLYTAAWLPHLADVLAATVDVFAPDSVVLRLGRSAQRDVESFGLADGDVLEGSPVDGPVRFQEHGLWFEADVVHGQKTGHFLDQRDNRALVGSMLRAAGGGQRVLDVYAATGGFSVHAAAAGAATVVSVDASAPTLAAAERNMALNTDLPEVRACRHRTVVGDAEEVMTRLHRNGERFDVVVVDPPSFAQRQEHVDRALAAYARLTERAAALLVDGGLLVQASCSSRVTADRFHATVLGALQRTDRQVDILRRTAHPIDHPVTFAEGAYLKAVFARVGPKS